MKLEEIPELPEGTSQAKSKKRSVPGREAGEYGQCLRCAGSGGAIADATGVVGSWKHHRGLLQVVRVQNLIWRF